MEVLEYSEVGTETIDGFKTRKFKARFRDQQGNEGEGFFWFTKHNIPIKMSMQVMMQGQSHTVTMHMQNLKVGGQRASLFEVPADYTRGSNNPFGGMFGGGQTAPADYPPPNRDTAARDTPDEPAQQDNEDTTNEDIYRDSKEAIDQGLKTLKGLFD